AGAWPRDRLTETASWHGCKAISARCSAVGGGTTFVVAGERDNVNWFHGHRREGRHRLVLVFNGEAGARRFSVFLGISDEVKLRRVSAMELDKEAGLGSVSIAASGGRESAWTRMRTMIFWVLVAVSIGVRCLVSVFG
ncbi:hypothetical protein TorRG33x02_007020, partial [Trema orientale]